MIKNVIFDIGNVLGHFCWEQIFVEKLGLSGEEFEAVADATTRSAMWNEFDRSLLKDEEIVDGCVKNAPEYEEKIREFFRHIGEIVIDYDYSEAWINELKERGYKVYILSNYGKTSFLKCIKNGNLKFLGSVDGKLISYEVCKVKPEPEIYNELLKRFDLKPEECVFIDDRKDNVEGAEKVGIKGILFTEYKSTKEELEKVLGEQ